jgi:hypothetical protein
MAEDAATSIAVAMELSGVQRVSGSHNGACGIAAHVGRGSRTVCPLQSPLLTVVLQPYRPRPVPCMRFHPPILACALFHVRSLFSPAPSSPELCGHATETAVTNPGFRSAPSLHAVGCRWRWPKKLTVPIFNDSIDGSCSLSRRDVICRQICDNAQPVSWCWLTVCEHA